ncbi:aldo/keto reductase-like protein [Bisporella sp. PMI_857]|nr:aldo/keto reductase-like protein [Bisporella sp. PMI_857]
MVQILGKEVGSTGLTWRPQPQPEEESFKAMKAAIAHGSVFWNGGEIYGGEYNSLVLLEKYFTKYPEDAGKVVLSIKGGVNLQSLEPDGSPEGVRRSIDHCIELLKGKKKIDIFECARVDRTVPIETTLKVIDEEYVKTGKIGGIALSEVLGPTIERAAKVTKIVAVEIELSLWAVDPLTNGTAEACAKNDIPIVAYSPLGRGILTGKIQTYADVPDYLKAFPRYSEENFPNNIKLIQSLEKISKKKGVSTGQLAISWVRQLSGKNGNPVIIPIPGATKPERIEENTNEVALSNEDISEIDSILKNFKADGGRYPSYLEQALDG